MKTFLSLLLFLICGCSSSRKQETASENTQEKKSSFFVSVPITKFSTQCPCVEITIDGNTFSMELDVGFQGHLSISKDYINQITSKTFIRTSSTYGFITDKKYLKNLYQINKIKIGNMSFINLTLQEESEEFAKDSSFHSEGKTPSLGESGRLGWKLFCNSNLLVDIKNSRIAFCDSLDTLKQQGYAVETFVRAPVFLENGMVEIDTKTPEGVLRCIIDTGSTYNILNTQDAVNKPIAEALFDEDNFLKYPTFQIEGHDFGPITFRPIASKTPFPLQAILGAEFFHEHLLFLDFSEGYAYFAKHPWMILH